MHTHRSKAGPVTWQQRVPLVGARSPEPLVLQPFAFAASPACPLVASNPLLRLCVLSSKAYVKDRAYCKPWVITGAGYREEK